MKISGTPRTGYGWALSLCLTLFALSTGCERLMSPAEIRASRARAEGPVTIGLTWPSTVSQGFDPGASFWAGAELASRELRGEAGLPRPIEVVLEKEDGTLQRSKEIAQRFAEDLDLVAMVGHRDAEVARMASVVYEDAGLVMMATGSSNRGLDRAGFERVFRLMPTDEELAARLAELAQAERLSPVLIVYANDPHGRAVANAFESRAEALGVKISERVSFESGAYRALAQALEESKAGGPRAVVLAERLPAAADVLELIRTAGLTVPVLATDDLDSPGVPALPAAQGVVVATPFTAATEGARDAAFVTAYTTKYGRAPDTWAHQGYLGVRLIAEAMIAAGSAEPAAISRALRSAEATSKTRVRFGARGEPLGRVLSVKRVQGREFVSGGAAMAPSAESSSESEQE